MFIMGFIGVATVLCSHVAADESFRSLVFVIDASGSMELKIAENRSKMDAVNLAFTALIQDMPPEHNVGLVVFGHRRYLR